MVLYAVKIVCGIPQKQLNVKNPVLAPGEYWTAVNIYNPNPIVVKFGIEIIVAPPDGTPKKSGPGGSMILDADSALEIDRDLMIAKLDSTSERTPFFKGFLVINSPKELDVVAVYTVVGKTGDVAFHTERVPPRTVIK